MTEGTAPDPHVYYTETVPAAFNRTLEHEGRAAAEDDPVYRDMLAVNGSIHVEIRSEEPLHFYLNIAAGRMTAGEAPSQAPFLTVILDRDSFRRVAQEAGDSLTTLLGTLAGLGGDMKLTSRRVRELGAVASRIRFDVTGASGFSVLTCFGVEAPPAQPDAIVRMSVESYRALREGRIDLQSAFLDDSIKVEGDLDRVLQVAFAAVAPD